MKYALIVVALFAVGCSESRNPVAPSPVTPPVVVVPPVTPPVTPPIITPPAPVFPPTDPRFDLAFYRAFVHDSYERMGDFAPLRRQTEAPRIYLRTIDDAGRAIDDSTLNQTAAALENTAGSLTGVFGLAGIERGTGTRRGQSGWITVTWSDVANPYCGMAIVGGDHIQLSPRSSGCRCTGGPAVRLRTVRHELGHALGFWHTGSASDLMSGLPTSLCDQQPSAREVYHAAVAYTRPIGSLAP